MNTVRVFAAIFLLLAGFVPPTAAQSPLALAPNESEIVARLDVKAFLETSLWDRILEEYGREKAQREAKFLQNMTDLDLFNDIDEIHLFGRIDEDESMIIVAKGRFNEEKLVDLVRLNESYEELQISGASVHSWIDDGNKHGVFLPDGLLVITGSRDAMEAVLRTRANPGTSFLQSDAGRMMPQDAAQAVFHGALVRTPWIDCEFGEFARAVDLQLATLSLNFANDQVAAALTAVPDRPERTAEYLEIANGLLAASKLLSEEQPHAHMAAKYLTAEQSGGTVRVFGSIDSRTAIEMIKNLDQ